MNDTPVIPMTAGVCKSQLKARQSCGAPAGLQIAAGHRQYSIERCHNLIGQKALPPEHLARLESLIQRVFRQVDEIELTGGGSILDRIYRAEKRGWANAAEFISIRELRSLIAREYATEKMLKIHSAP